MISLKIALSKFDFYPRPPRGGRPAFLPSCSTMIFISIHALREEGDACAGSGDGNPCYFYPRPPRGGRRQVRRDQWRVQVYFYPRPPRGGRRHPPRRSSRCKPISIHALREEGDNAVINNLTTGTDFYPRPPRGGRRPILQRPPPSFLFLSTPSARRATYDSVSHPVQVAIFLSTPSARRATFKDRRYKTPDGFLSTPSARRATQQHQLPGGHCKFLSTPSARRATRVHRRHRQHHRISIHALREEGDKDGGKTK